MSVVSHHACRLRVRGVVQGVGFRPFVFRLARAHQLAGWVLNAESGVEIHIEGPSHAIDEFARDLRECAPMAASIGDVEVTTAHVGGYEDFQIRASVAHERPTARISPDLPICGECLNELLAGSDRRRDHAYISCAHCGPRYSIVTALPYDRARTTMAPWPMCGDCRREYHDPADRRFHAQPIACSQCGPRYSLLRAERIVAWDRDAVATAARLIRDGKIVGMKGIGGFHLTCDATNPEAVLALRTRKYRKEKPFAVMAKDVASARALVDLSSVAEEMLTSPARPIVLAPARVELRHVAPDSRELGVMLPYAPIHHLLFERDAPSALVMTSANRSNEPIAYEDADARERLAEITDALLIGERRIARRVEDSVVRVGALGPQILRRSRGYTPGVAARIPLPHPTLCVGADLKNSVTLVVNGEALVSQHLGDLDNAAAFRAFEETIRDLMAMYEVDVNEMRVVHDLHPEYASTRHATLLPAYAHHAVQHHRAHVASVLAEREAFERRVLGVAFDGTGYGDDGTIWGGEFFVGSVNDGFERVGHLRRAVLPGGDAAARNPVQAAAGFLAELERVPDLMAPPFSFPRRFREARRLLETGVRTFLTTSVGRLFDTVAALCGFTRENTFEGQAAMWLEHVAGKGPAMEGAPLVFRDSELDFREVLDAVIRDRLAGRPESEIARQFHYSLACGIADATRAFCEQHNVSTVAFTGGVFQNALLLHDLERLLARSGIELWTNRTVPPNDGGVSLGQAALMLQVTRSLPSAPAGAPPARETRA
ncbi:MAG: carbamoyltransferase HypF [Gemmatimonadota bacterium]|nr:carbamoyltransferase HypF [Gemmatimonadota bacterium]